MLVVVPSLFRGHCRLDEEVLHSPHMPKNPIASEIAEGLLSAGATADSVNEKPPLVIKEIAPYPALFRAEIRRRFGVRLEQKDLDKTIDELASLISPTPAQQ